MRTPTATPAVGCRVLPLAPRPAAARRRPLVRPARATLIDAAHAASTAAPAAIAQLADAPALIKIPGVLGDSPFVEGAVSGFLLILFSELGDKTFFIALLLALRKPKGAVFAGTFGALAVMTVISVRNGCETEVDAMPVDWLAVAGRAKHGCEWDGRKIATY